MKRSVNLDLIRSVATIGVVSVHFFYNSGFYGYPVNGFGMYVMTGMRTAFMFCVPLFLLLTGYLMNKKELSIKYYKGMIHTLEIYVIVGIITMLYASLFLHESYGLKRIVLDLLNFSAAPYSWYIEMYIGLFLLIPFLNIIYNHISNKKWLIFTVAFMTCLPTSVNAFGIKVLPNWWINIYPICYYFIGAYLSENKASYMNNTKKHMAYLLITVALNSLVAIYLSKGDVYSSNALLRNWESILYMALSVELFIFLNGLKLDKIPHWSVKLIASISKYSLGIYLCSWITDNYFYSEFAKIFNFESLKLSYFFVLVITSFCFSFILSFIIEKIIGVFNLVLKRMCKKIKIDALLTNVGNHKKS